jgi:hypothetical protein
MADKSDALGMAANMRLLFVILFVELSNPARQGQKYF